MDRQIPKPKVIRCDICNKKPAILFKGTSNKDTWFEDLEECEKCYSRVCPECRIESGKDKNNISKYICTNCYATEKLR